MKSALLLPFLLLFLASMLLLNDGAFAQSAADSLQIKVHFLYGSKPKKGAGHSERKEFGGLHGGHVTIEVETTNFGFGPNKGFHVFGKKNNRVSKWYAYPLEYWAADTLNAGEKYTTFTIPVSRQQYDSLKKLMVEYALTTPYDYAFIGMRCASATWDILAQAGILQTHSKSWMILRCFYPKLFRNKLFKQQKEMHIDIHRQPGRDSRKWEMDKRKFR